MVTAGECETGKTEWWKASLLDVSRRERFESILLTNDDNDESKEHNDSITSWNQYTQLINLPAGAIIHSLSNRYNKSNTSTGAVQV